MRGFCFVGLLALAGCSSLLYYPDTPAPRHYSYYDPKAYGLDKAEDIYFTAEDGVRLHGWYFKSAHPKALVVHFHGNAANLSAHFTNDSWLVPAGYDYFIFDYRGYGFSDGSPSPEGTVKDGHAALRWAAGRGLPLVVHGQSLGGAVALRSVIDLRAEIPVRAVIAESTFASYRAVGRSVLAKSWFTWPFQPLAWLALSDRWAPSERVSEIAPTPLIVIHGDRDPTVDYALGEKLFALAREPKEFWPIPGGGHINAFWIDKGAHRAELLKKLDEILRVK